MKPRVEVRQVAKSTPGSPKAPAILVIDGVEFSSITPGSVPYPFTGENPYPPTSIEINTAAERLVEFLKQQ